MTWHRPHESDEEPQTRSEANWIWAEGMVGRWRPPTRMGHFHPPTDVYETDEGVAVIVEIAGLDERELSIYLQNRTLTIRGARRGPVGKVIYQQMEIQYGEFHTEVYLPWPVEEDKVDAQYEKGFLRVTLQKAQARRVPIANKNT
ncbi:MAG: Hsp20/alpha crystallin family protein [Anaerolineae bacterium]|nr:Hsp20/alpha crystallin family protein [Anaerolineae bacterium]